MEKRWLENTDTIGREIDTIGKEIDMMRSKTHREKRANNDMICGGQFSYDTMEK